MQMNVRYAKRENEILVFHFKKYLQTQPRINYHIWEQTRNERVKTNFKVPFRIPAWYITKPCNAASDIKGRQWHQEIQFSERLGMTCDVLGSMYVC